MTMKRASLSAARSAKRFSGGPLRALVFAGASLVAGCGSQPSVCTGAACAADVVDVTAAEAGIDATPDVAPDVGLAEAGEDASVMPDVAVVDVAADTALPDVASADVVIADVGPDVTCPSGQRLCGSTCVTTNTDVNNCGSCGNVCPAPTDSTATCTGGVCGITCVLGTSNCGGACVNVTSSTENCGACGTRCTGGQVCRTGACAAACASGNTLCGAECVTLGDNEAHCGACSRACATGETCESGVCVTPVSVDPIGCADGTREAFADRARFPNIAACSGAWQQAGVFPAIPASTAASCATLGNSSTTAPADGAGCSAANLCARGWHICNGGDVTPRTTSSAGSGCAATTDYPSNSFFIAAVSGTGCYRCALRSNTVTGPTCTSNSCTADCQESGDLNNDIFGCGTIGRAVTGACDGIDRTGGNNCADITSTTWTCGGAVMESRTVTKTGAANGGVLCCR